MNSCKLPDPIHPGKLQNFKNALVAFHTTSHQDFYNVARVLTLFGTRTVNAAKIGATRLEAPVCVGDVNGGCSCTRGRPIVNVAVASAQVIDKLLAIIVVVAKVIARLVVGGRGEKSVIGARKWLAARYNIAAVATVAAWRGT